MCDPVAVCRKFLSEHCEFDPDSCIPVGNFADILYQRAGLRMKPEAIIHALNPKNENPLVAAVGFIDPETGKDSQALVGIAWNAATYPPQARIGGDWFVDFLEQNCYRDPDSWIPTSDLRNRAAAWASVKFTPIWFGKRLHLAGIPGGQKWINGKNVRAAVGLAWKTG